MTAQDFFAKQAFALALGEAFGIALKPEAVSVSSMSDEEIYCFGIYPGGVAEGIFRGEEDGGQIRITAIGQGHRLPVCSYWYESSPESDALIPVVA